MRSDMAKVIVDRPRTGGDGGKSVPRKGCRKASAKMLKIGEGAAVDKVMSVEEPMTDTIARRAEFGEIRSGSLLGDKIDSKLETLSYAHVPAPTKPNPLEEIKSLVGEMDTRGDVRIMLGDGAFERWQHLLRLCGCR